jgi:hypothetical protein
MSDQADMSAQERNLFQSDMTLMTGMTPKDPMGGMPMTKWMFMDLGIARLDFNRQGGPSGARVGESTNWNMAMVQRTIGPGLLSVMMMNSLEPATLHKKGTPELFQTGEEFDGKPLVDIQHQHDFFMNISATYRLNLGPESGAWLQLAPVGEPALGPTAYMHRASSGDNPLSPLGHHWQDATHITFDVATVGTGWRFVSVEASAFHGQEPDQNRWNLESGKIDSASGRLTFRPGPAWQAQVSQGFIKNAERLAPGDVRRTTASIQYGAEGDRPFAVTLLWGRNREDRKGTSDSYLAEAAYQLGRLDQVFARIEYVEKDFELLATKQEGDSTRLARIGAYTAGYLHDFELVPGLRTGLGADATLYSLPSDLEPVYGSKPVSYQVFVRLRWGNPHAGSMAMKSRM